MKKPNWYVALLLKVGIVYRNFLRVLRGTDANDLKQREYYESISCGHGVRREYRDKNGELRRQDYTVVLSNEAIKPASGSAQF